MRLLTYRLAERLHMIREEMLERMSAEELGDWLAILHMELQSSKADKPATPITSKQQTPQEMIAVLKSLAPRERQSA